MKKTNTASLIVLSLCLATGFTVVGSVVLPQAAYAADKPKTVSEKVSKQVKAAQEAIAAKNLKEAIAKLEEANKVPGKTAFDTYAINTYLGAVYYETKNYGDAAEAYERSLASGEVPPGDAANIAKNVAVMYYQTKNYPKTIEAAQRALKDNPNDAELLNLVPTSYFLQNNFKGAADAARAAVRSAQTAGKAPKEDLLQLWMSAEYKLDQNSPGVLAALEQLVSFYPKTEYWKNYIQLAEVALQNGPAKTRLDIYAVKFHLGMLTTAAEYTEMAQLALQDGLPGLAKKVVDKGMSTSVLGQAPATKEREARLQTMTNTQADADMKNLAKGETEAKKQPKGDALVRAGEAYDTYGQSDKAADVIQEGITKGVANVDDAKLRLGIAYVHAGKTSQAQEAFKGIAANSTQAKIAKLWSLAAAKKA